MIQIDLNIDEYVDPAMVARPLWVREIALRWHLVCRWPKSFRTPSREYAPGNQQQQQQQLRRRDGGKADLHLQEKQRRAR